MFAGALVIWPVAPDRIPVHWSFDGRVDRWGGKLEGLLGIRLLALAIYLLMRYLPRTDPGRANYARFGGAYTAVPASWYSWRCSTSPSCSATPMLSGEPTPRSSRQPARNPRTRSRKPTKKKALRARNPEGLT